MSEKKVPFLQWVAQKIIEIPQEKRLASAIILPSKRSCKVLQDHIKTLLMSTNTTAFLLPEIVSIQDFWTRWSGFAILDKDLLLLELYSIYQKYWSEDISFEDFLPWGKMMLSDFDEIDKYDVNAQKLFTIIQDEKDIMEQFSIEEELKSVMSHFWNIVQSEKPFEKSFVKTWKLMGNIYPAFAQHLREQSLAYEGLAYRNLYEKLLKNPQYKLPHDEIWFVGFNAFTVIDEKLIQRISENNEVLMFWDVDAYFMKNEDHEAGNFLRTYDSLFSKAHHHWNSGTNLSTHRKYFLHAAPMHLGQIKVVKDILKNTQDENLSTGIVLCEETIIEPFLFEIQSEKKFNITMSWAVGGTTLTHWLEILLKIQQQKESIHKGDLILLFKQYFFRTIISEYNVSQFERNIIQSHSYYFSRKILTKYIPELLDNESKNLETLNGVCDFWIQSLLQLQSKFENVEDNIKIIIPYFIQAITEKQIQLKKFETLISFKAVYQLLLSHIKNIKIPFLTDAQEKIQIMGFLETRLMDFDRVIIVGANEEILPKTKRGNSYIPYSFRKPFGLPTLKEYDGVYSYHFFRLLQRSKESHLIYNHSPGDLPFEKSRFLGQILLELNSPENIIVQKNWVYPISTQVEEKKSGWTIQKTTQHIEKLQAMKFSQSSLLLYLRCPIQFYLKYIAEIKEPESTEENIEANVFGNIMHKAIELLYLPLIGKVVDEHAFSPLKPLVADCLKEAFEREFRSFEHLEGENLLAYDMIYQTILTIVDKDMDLAKEQKFTILGLEENYEQSVLLPSGKKSFLKGKIDRVDQIGNHYRIIDYKTGKITLTPKEQKELTNHDMESIFKRHHTKTKQQIFQGMLYYKLLGFEKNVEIGFYGIRNLSEGLLYINGSNEISEELKTIFEDELTLLMEEILDPDQPFIQNTDEEAYKFSPYTFIAGNKN